MILAIQILLLSIKMMMNGDNNYKNDKDDNKNYGNKDINNLIMI